MHAQNLRGGAVPAEIPPSSFRGAQYVDSKGCVFIRAGIDGNVTWVPRVNRQRQVLCGQTPSLSTQAAEAARTTPRAAAATSGVEQITLPPSAAAPAVPAARTAAAPTPPVAAPARTVTRTAAPTPAPAPRRAVTVAAPAPAAPAQRTVVRRVAPPAAPTPAPVIVSSPPAKAAPAPAQRTAAPSVSPTTRVVPRQVFDARQTQTGLTIPEGYRPVWSDERLNPRRAEQTLEGVARTRLIWTQTVPRRLIDQNTGRDVTSKVALVYPYTDTATQQRDLGTVTLVRRDGQLQKRIVRNKAKARAPVVSTRSAPVPAPVVKQAARATPKAQASAKGRFVQVGTYAQPGNAKAAAQRIARVGLPARMGTLKRDGKTYKVVFAGPFASSDALNNGLRTSRAAGFGDAFVR